MGTASLLMVLLRVSTIQQINCLKGIKKMIYSRQEQAGREDRETTSSWKRRWGMLHSN